MPLSVVLTVLVTLGSLALVRTHDAVVAIRDGVGGAGHAVGGLIDRDRRADGVEPGHLVDLGCGAGARAAG